MNTLRDLRAIEQRFEQQRGFADFIRCALLIMTTKNLTEAADKATRSGVSASVCTALTKAVSAATTGNTGVSTFSPLITAFMAQVRNVGAFDRIAADALNLPLRPGNVIIDVSSITASSPAEGAAKSLSAIHLGAEDFSPTKAIAQVVLTRELIDGLGDEAVRVLGRELVGAVAVGSDTAFFTTLAASGSSEAAPTTPATFDSILVDLEELLHLVRLGATSKPYFVVTQEIAKALATKATGAGISTVGVSGGTILGIEVLVSDGQVDGQVTLVDARGLAIAQAPIELRSSDKASIEMSATPSHNATSPTATTLVSMFQTNSRCLLAERQFAVVVVRPNAVATLTGVDWGGTGGSPAGF